MTTPDPAPTPSAPAGGFTVSIRFVPGRSIAADASFDPLPGETHERGRDLADGPWSEATLDRICADLRMLLVQYDTDDSSLTVELRAEWGEDFSARMEAARRAVHAVGLSEWRLARMEGALGSAELVRLMARIGAMVGADFVGPEVTDSTPTPTNPPPPPIPHPHPEPPPHDHGQTYPRPLHDAGRVAVPELADTFPRHRGVRGDDGSLHPQRLGRGRPPRGPCGQGGGRERGPR